MQPNNQEQANVWNGPGGQAWVQSQRLLDGLFRPLELLLASEVTPGERVLDIGCGAGSTTLAASRVGGRCTGVDISQPMIEAARKRAQRDGLTIDFQVADAQSYPFAASSFDLVLSRFGIMFFADPVAAFQNIRSATASGGRLAMIAWRGPTENPFMTAAERAAAPLFPDAPLRKPSVGGQFAFADRDAVRQILEKSGWSDVSIDALDAPCTMPASELVSYFTSIGPVANALREADPDLQARIVEAVRPAFDPFVRGDEVQMTAACWMLRATSR